MRILLTRPRAQAAETASRLAACGHLVEIAPMLEIHALSGPPIDARDIAAVLFTSANGVQFGAPRLAARDAPVLCVGRRTAQAAEAAGFHRVAHAGGNAEDLARLAISRLAPEDGTLLHLCGRDRKAALADTVRAGGYDIRETPVYEARPAATLPERFREGIETGDIDLVLVYSARAAERLAQLLAVGGDARRLAARLGALSEPAARPLAARFGAVVVPDRPEEAALMEALTRATGESFPAAREANSGNGGA